ncbi:MAG TPA: PQQ-binding-like beta-propeller repeat protein [Pirellulales bacterium]|nr:PQQ-binding-like beta-propeller repeat protein [Pirellulales bacterium]
MTDAELIELVQQTPPEHLSPEQLAELRRRLAGSAELQQALVEQLRLEQVMFAGLGRARIDFDAVLLRARRGERVRRGVLLAIPLIVAMIAVAAWFAIADRSEPPIEQPPVVQIVGTARDTMSKRGATPAESMAERTHPLPDQPPADLPAAAPPVAPATSAQEPWTAGLEQPPRPFEQACFDDLPPSSAATAALLQRWWRPIAGKHQPAQKGGTWGLSLKGTFSLRAPWQPGTALRLAVAASEAFRLHCIAGASGVMIAYDDRHGDRWLAYTTTVRSGKQLPELASLVGDDDGRFRRCGRGTVELRWQDGLIVVSRGDVLLLAVPLESPPQRVVLDTDDHTAFIDAMQFVRCEPFPLALPPRTTSLASSRPSELDWHKELPAGGAYDADENGRLRLSTTDAKHAARVWQAVAEPGLRQVVLEIESPEPGTAVYLGDADGRPRYAIGFFRNKRSGQLAFGFLRGNEKRTETSYSEKEMIPLAGEHIWLRLHLAAGLLRCWSSVDGQHWCRAFEPLRGGDLPYATIGLFCSEGRGTRSLALRSLRIERLDGLQVALPIAWRDGGPDSLASADPAAWRKRVAESRPAETDPRTWRDACALRTLAAGAPATLSRELVAGLAADVADARLPLGIGLTALSELALLSDSFDTSRCFSRLGQEALARGEELPYSHIRRALLEAPSSAGASEADSAIDDRIQAELFELVSRGQWQLLRESCRRFTFFFHPAIAAGGRRPTSERGRTIKLVEWGSVLAQRNSPPGDERVGPLPAVPVSWRHPLIERLGKEEFNALAEFDAAVASGADKDACQIITNIVPKADEGLLPSSRDPDLLVSLRGAIAAVMAEHPALRDTMRSEFGPVGMVRLRQAIHADDHAAITAIPLQFPATAAAAEARVWVGDRELSRGYVREAQQHYLAAERETSGEPSAGLSARQRLAGALLGRDVGQPATERVRLGDTVLEPERFEAIVAQACAAAKRAGENSPFDETGVPAPATYRLDPLPAEAAVDVAPRPSAEVTMLTDPIVAGDEWIAITLTAAQQESVQLSLARFDRGTAAIVSQTPLVQLRDVWKGRVPASIVAVDDGVLFVGGGCVAAASFDGELKWLRRQTWIGGVVEPPHDARPVPPLIAGGSVVVWQPGVPYLTCLDRTTGAIHWQRVMPRVQWMLALGHDRLVVQSHSRLSMLRLDTGELTWLAEPGEGIQVLAADERFVLLAAPQGSEPSATFQLLWLNAADGSVSARSILELPDKQLGIALRIISHQGKTLALQSNDAVATLVRIGPADEADASWPNDWLLPPSDAKEGKERKKKR